MEILKFPNPILMKKCDPVTVFDKELHVLVAAMFDTMNGSNGMGLAANQVGIPFRMFVMRATDGRAFCIINPKIVERSKNSANLKEGCLSAPGEFLTLSERASWVRLEYQSVSGEKLKGVFMDLNAVCVQHEMDHLDGKSHLQSASIPKQKRKELAKKWGLK